MRTGENERKEVKGQERRRECKDKGGRDRQGSRGLNDKGGMMKVGCGEKREL